MLFGEGNSVLLTELKQMCKMCKLKLETFLSGRLSKLRSVFTHALRKTKIKYF